VIHQSLWQGDEQILARQNIFFLPKIRNFGLEITHFGVSIHISLVRNLQQSVGKLQLHVPNFITHDAENQ